MSRHKKLRFTESQIVAAIKRQGAGSPVKEICRDMGISEATFHNWNGKYVGIEASDVKRLKELEAELARYKKLVGELTSENKAMRGLIEKKL